MDDFHKVDGKRELDVNHEMLSNQTNEQKAFIHFLSTQVKALIEELGLDPHLEITVDFEYDDKVIRMYFGEKGCPRIGGDGNPPGCPWADADSEQKKP